MARLRGVTARDDGTDLTDLFNAEAERHGLPPELLLALAIAESEVTVRAQRWGRHTAAALAALAADDRAALAAVVDRVERETPGDISFGLFQQTVRWADEGDHTSSLANIFAVRDLYFDPRHATAVAARKLAHFFRAHGDPLEALCRYNKPSLAGRENLHRARYAECLHRAARFLAPAGPGPTVAEAPMWIDVAGQLPRNPNVDFERRLLAQISLLVVHYDGGPPITYPAGDPVQYYRKEARIHIERDWGGGDFGAGIMYHLKVSRDDLVADRTSRVYLVNSFENVTWHATRANRIGLGVCVDATVGQDPTPAQLRNLGRLLDHLTSGLPGLAGLTRANVFGHGELTQFGNATACPGPKLLEWVQRYREQGATQEHAVEPEPVAGAPAPVPGFTIVSPHEWRSDLTGHTIQFRLLQLYQNVNGLRYLGHPLDSQWRDFAGQKIRVFEKAVVVFDGSNSPWHTCFEFASIGREWARDRGLV